MSPGPGLPKLPPLPPSPIKGIRDALRQGHQQMEKAKDGIRSIADDIGGGVTKTTAATKPATHVQAPKTTSTPVLPTREETTRELKRRLAKELYRAELDLSSGLRIAGAPCDCLGDKHTLGLEATAEELIAQEPENPIYVEILQWIKDNHSKVTIEAIESGQYDNEYPRMAGEFKGFRKRIMGTNSLIAMTRPEKQISLEEAKKLAAEEAAREVEKIWHSQEKKQRK